MSSNDEILACAVFLQAFKDAYYPHPVRCLETLHKIRPMSKTIPIKTMLELRTIEEGFDFLLGRGYAWEEARSTWAARTGMEALMDPTHIEKYLEPVIAFQKPRLDEAYERFKDDFDAKRERATVIQGYEHRKMVAYARMGRAMGIHKEISPSCPL